jgi:acylpyruvate hydrolase
MQFVSYSEAGQARVGIVRDGKVHDVSALVPSAPDDMIAIIAAGPDLLGQFAQALENANPAGRPLSELTLLTPIPAPGKVVCLGLNYVEHAREGGRDVPEHPTLFLRVNSSLLAPNAPVPMPAVSTKLDYEAELLVVIGKRAKNVTETDALDFVFGYSAFNDITLRDYQRRTSQWTAGKNFDGTGAMGPVIVTADELPPGASGLAIRSRLNGAVMQDGNTGEMVFSVARMIADISEIMTLEPGDVIATGTPSGVGFARKPPVWMKPGDVIEVEIEGMPVLRNTIGS